MADRVVPGALRETTMAGREAVCIHTRKIFDSCRDKDCIEDLRVFPLKQSQTALEGALSIRPRSAELLNVEVDVEEIAFNRGFYTVDVKYFYLVRGTIFPGGSDFVGCSVFDKRVILFGSEGNAKVFSSEDGALTSPDTLKARNAPIAEVEAVDPIALSMKMIDMRNCAPEVEETTVLPEYISSLFGEEISLATGGPMVYVTLGQFSIIRLERDTQIMLPSIDYYIPDKECAGACEEDPCTLFGKIPFPVEEFFPPDNSKDAISYQELLDS